MIDQQPLHIKKRAGLRGRSVATYLVGLLVLGGVFFGGVAVGQGGFEIKRQSIGASQENQKLPGSLDYSSVDSVYEALKDNFDGELDSQALQDGLKQGLAEASGDPYTQYFSEQAAEEFNQDLNGTFTGIGAELGTENDALIIVAPISGFPADKAGVRAKDVILEIDGERAYDMLVTDAVKKIRGEKGTVVKLKILRGQEQIDFEITRDQIVIASVETKILDGNIGYMKISRFAEDTTKLAKEGAQQFKDAGVNGVVLDLRNDPGGYLNAAVDVSSLWLKAGDVVLTERRGDVVQQTLKANGVNTLQGIKTVVLINEGSASASEIMAGALRDNNAATIVGVKSYGKGSVQDLIPVDDGGMLKVTIARWYTPAGKNIDKEGITPDHEVKLSDEDIEKDVDPQQAKALELLKQ